MLSVHRSLSGIPCNPSLCDARVLTGSILAVSRAAGEVAPILIVGAAYYLPHIPTRLNDQFMNLGYHVFIMSTQSPDVDATKPYFTRPFRAAGNDFLPQCPGRCHPGAHPHGTTERLMPSTAASSYFRESAPGSLNGRSPRKNSGSIRSASE